MKIIKSTKVYNSNWLNVMEIEYHNRLENKSHWYYATRNTESRLVKAVLVIGEIDNKLIIIRQFRLPFNNYVYEFPAGLVDDGENIEEAGIREFKEETGYDATFREKSIELSTSSGLTDEMVSFVFVDIDKNQTPKTNHQDSEDIQILYIEKKDFKSFLKEIESKGEIIDSKLYLYLLLSQ